MNRFLSTIVLSLWTMLAMLSSAAAGEKLLVFAPSSMTETMATIAKTFEAETETKVTVSVAGTAQLARQIEAGAPADIFISADREWLDWLGRRRLIKADQAQAIARNQLVIAVRNETENWVNVEELLTKSRFAMADPNSVPAGRYARQALQSKGWWGAAQTNAVLGENVRVTLQRVAMGEVSAAIVYASDLQVEPRVRSVFTFQDKDHDPIVYWAATTSTAKPRAAKYLGFLNNEKARSIFAKAGFKEPKL